jgi:hypothetical protein
MKKIIMLATVLMTLSAVSFASENSDCTQSLDQELLSRSEAGSVSKEVAAEEKQEEVNSTVK